VLNQGKGAQAYAKADLRLTNDPQDILVKVYDKSIECLSTAKRLFLAGESSFDNHVATVQRVLAELITSLKDPEEEFSQGLASLYFYLIRSIDSLEIGKADAKPLDEAIDILTELRDAWKQAFGKERKSDASSHRQPGATGAVNVSL
jgi:flagellar protein FliS